MLRRVRMNSHLRLLSRFQLHAIVRLLETQQHVVVGAYGLDEYDRLTAARNAVLVTVGEFGLREQRQRFFEVAPGIGLSFRRTASTRASSRWPTPILNAASAIQVRSGSA